MLCQSCGQKQASTHIKTVKNGRLTEAFLCAECAQKNGYLQAMHPYNLGSLIGSMLQDSMQESKTPRCEKCGSTFEEIMETGKIGCAECYILFQDQLSRMVQRIHGTAVHKGKRPGGSALLVQEKNPGIVKVKEERTSKKNDASAKNNLLQQKELALRTAIEKQDFEQAAVLRDEIKELKENG